MSKEHLIKDESIVHNLNGVILEINKLMILGNNSNTFPEMEINLIKCTGIVHLIAHRWGVDITEGLRKIVDKHDIKPKS